MDGGPWAGGRAGAGDADADDSDGGRSDDGGGGDGSAMGGGFGDAGDDGDGGPAGRSRRAGSRKRYHDAEMEAGGDDDGEDDDGADFESAKPKAWNKPWSKPFVGRVCDKCGTEAQKHARRCVCGELLSARSKANAVNPQKRRRTTNIVSRKAKAVFGGEPELDDGGQRIIDVIVARRLRPGFSHIDDVGHLDAFAFEYHLKWRQASRLKLEWVSAELISQLGKKSKGVLSRFQQKVAEEEVDEDLTCDVERIVDSRMTSVFETIEALKDEDAAMDVDASAENVAAQNGAQNGAATAPEKGNGAAHGANGGADGGALAAPAPRPPAVAAPAVEHEERALIPALLELTADGRWHVDGEHVGCWITRTCSTNKYTGEVRSSVGRVTGWLAARDSDFVDSSRSYAALWHVQYYSGDLVGDEEDLETHQVLESAPRNSSGSEDAERNWVNARPGVPSAKLAAEVLRVRRIIEYIAEDANAWMFVPPIDIEGYAEVVWPNLPTCLQGIVGDIDRGFYQSAEKVASDVRIVWANCGVYNGRDSEIALYADAFAMRFERLFLTWMRYAQVPPLPLLDAPETPACAHCDSTVCELRDGVRRCDLCRPRGERGALPFASEEEATFRRAEFAALPKREVKRLQYLVKWRSEAYDASTWEHAGELRTTFRAKIERFNALKEWAESHRDDGRSFAEAERLPAPPPSSGSFFEISVAHQEFGRISFDVRAVQPAYYIIVVGVNPPTAEQAAQALAAPPDRTEGKSSEGGGAVDQIGRLRWGDVVFELGANRLLVYGAVCGQTRFGLPLEQLRTTLGVLHRQQQTLRMLVCRPIGHTGDLDSVLKQARQAASERQAYVARPPVREMRAPKTPLPKPRRTRNDARELRPYQQHGVNWLLTNRAEKRGCILADEMGLGKTAQVANALERDYVESGLPTMVVAPLSTIEQWRRELEAWTNLEVCVYHGVSARGSSRDLVREFEWWPFGMQQGGRRGGGVAFDVLVTTYEIVQQDAAALRSVSWGAVVVDEAHRLKRDNSRLAECIEKALSGNGHSSDVWRCLVTGTPLQNNLKEMWSLLHFCDPIGFASHKSFEVQFGNIESHGDVVQLALLKDTLKPRLLRRVKEDVAKDIPEKRETVVDVELTLTQKRLYRAIYERNALALQSASCSASALRSVQMQLRNACNHASLVHGIDASYAAAEKDSEGRDALVSGSGKFVLLEKLLPRLKAEGRKVLIFSQFVRLLDLLARLCVTRGHDFERIDGTIKMVDRQTSIDRFNDPKSNAFIFLISTRAGGVGLNLQAADTVIIFDSDWNPQNDLQAQARCHRLGQTRDVMVYRLVASRSFERTMFDRASKKLGLERAVLGAPGQSEEDADKQPSKKALQDLLKLGAFQLLTDDKERELQMSQQFGDADIDSILAERSSTRVVAATSNDKETFDGKITVSSTSFGGDGGAGGIKLDDPEFWTKICNQQKAPEVAEVEDLGRRRRGGPVPRHDKNDKHDKKEVYDAVSEIAARADAVQAKRDNGDRHFHRELHKVTTDASRAAHDSSLTDSQRMRAAQVRDSLMPKAPAARGSRRAARGDDDASRAAPAKRRGGRGANAGAGGAKAAAVAETTLPYRVSFSAFLGSAVEREKWFDAEAAKLAATQASAAEASRAAQDRAQAQNAIRLAVAESNAKSDTCTSKSNRRRRETDKARPREAEKRGKRSQRKKDASDDEAPTWRRDEPDDESHRRHDDDEDDDNGAGAGETGRIPKKSKLKWSAEDDMHLLRLMQDHGSLAATEETAWKPLAEKLSRATRKDVTARQVRERWRNALDPALSSEAFTPAEDGIIVTAVAQRGKKWMEISKLLPGRTDSRCKFRFQRWIKAAFEAFVEEDVSNLDLLMAEDYGAVEDVLSRCEDAGPEREEAPKPVKDKGRWLYGGHEHCQSYVSKGRSVLRIEAWDPAGPTFLAKQVLGGALDQTVILSHDEVTQMGSSASLETHVRAIGVETVQLLKGGDGEAFAEAVAMIRMDDAIAQTSEEWRAAYGCVVWAAHLAKEPAWPSLVLDPRTFVGDAKIRQRAMRKLGQEHVVRFFGQPASKSFGFIAIHAITPFSASAALKGDQLRAFSKRTQREYLEGVDEASQAVDEAQAGNAGDDRRAPREPPPVGSYIGVVWEGDAHEFRCQVLRSKTSGALLVTSTEFGAGEPASIPFDPNEDQWRQFED